MRTLLATLGFAALVAVGAAAAPQDRAYAQAAAINLTGTWKGAYIAQGGGDANTMDVTFSQKQGLLSGSMIELNAFGDTSRALFLTSTISGGVRGSTVEFTKTYDGAGGVSHSVDYKGVLDATGRRIRGTFTVADTGGTFELVR